MAIRVQYRPAKHRDAWTEVVVKMDGIWPVVGFARFVPLVGKWTARLRTPRPNRPHTSMHMDRTSAAQWRLIEEQLAQDPTPARLRQEVASLLRNMEGAVA